MFKTKVKKLKLKRIKSRGSTLDIIEFEDFKIKRVFTISNVSKNVTRGRHAHKLDSQIITVPQGNIQFLTYDGKNKRKFIISTPNTAILVKPMIWTEIKYLDKNTVVVVYSDRKYNEKSYIRKLSEFKSLFKD